jgi:hypothetical protein
MCYSVRFFVVTVIKILSGYPPPFTGREVRCAALAGALRLALTDAEYSRRGGFSLDLPLAGAVFDGNG